jgi:hypothetical protein
MFGSMHDNGRAGHLQVFLLPYESALWSSDSPISFGFISAVTFCQEVPVYQQFPCIDEEHIYRIIMTLDCSGSPGFFIATDLNLHC